MILTGLCLMFAISLVAVGAVSFHGAYRSKGSDRYFFTLVGLDCFAQSIGVLFFRDFSYSGTVNCIFVAGLWAFLIRKTILKCQKN